MMGTPSPGRESAGCDPALPPRLSLPSLRQDYIFDMASSSDEMHRVVQPLSRFGVLSPEIVPKGYLQFP